MANGTRAHQLGADPISMGLRIPAFIDTLLHNRRVMALAEEKAALDAEIARETHEAEYGKDVPDLSRRIDWGQTIAPSMNVAIGRPSPTAPEYHTKRIPGLKERALGLEEKGTRAYEARTGIMGRRVGVEEKQEARLGKAFDLEEAMRTVDKQPLSPDEYTEVERIMDDDDATNDTTVARAMEPLLRRLKGRINRGTKYETYQGLKQVLATPGVQEKFVARLQRARAHPDLIAMVEDGTFLDLQMPVCAALDKIKVEERAAKAGVKALEGPKKLKAVEDLKSALDKVLWTKKGDKWVKRDPSPQEVQILREQANAIGYNLEVTGEREQVRDWRGDIPSTLNIEIVPQRKKQGLSLGLGKDLKVTGGPPAPTQEEAAAYLRSQGISF